LGLKVGLSLALAGFPNPKKRIKQPMSSFSTYLLGFIVLIIGLAIAAYLLIGPSIWIAVGAVILIGIGILSGTSRTKAKDPPTT